MIRQIRMMWFHLRQFVAVPYFIQLMVLATISLTLIQALAHYAWGGNPWVMWVRAGIIGMWTTSTRAAGILGFERFKGTLVHLVAARINPLFPLAAVISAAATFGLASLPIAWATWGLTGLRTGPDWGRPPQGWPVFTAAVILLWLACLSVTFVVASFFILTPNAIAYEELLLTPVFLFSGLVFTTTSAPTWLSGLGTIIPLREPVAVLLGTVPRSEVPTSFLVGLGTTCIWFILAAVLGARCLNRVRYTATLEVI